MALVKYQNYETGIDGQSFMSISAGYDYAQTFTPAISHYLEKIELLFYRVGTVNDVTIEIRATSAGKPLGTNAAYGEALATKTVDVSGITTDTAGEWVAFTLGTPISLTAGVMYAIVVYSDIYNATNKVGWKADLTEAAYTGGTRCKYTTFDWVLYTDDDLAFRDWGKLTIGSDPPPANVAYTKKLVAISANEVWYESSAGTMEELTAANDDIDVTKGLDIVEAYGKVFIANGTNLKVADFVNIKITTADLGANPPDYKTVLTANGGAKMVVDYITALTGACTIYGKLITTTEFGAETITGKDDNNNDISFTGTAQVAGPHWYDWTVYGNSSNFGKMPDQATIVALYQGRVTLSGDEDYSHMWYQTRQGNPWNFLYGINDAQSAVAGGDADAGEIGDVVTAVIPYKDDFCIYGAAGSIWYLVGNAAEGGVILELSLTAGMLASKAWCWDNGDNLYILATTGLLKIPRGFGLPDNLTKQSYPNFIKDLAYNDSTDRLTMGYDRIRHGICICKTTLSDGTNKNWWFDLKVGGGKEPTAIQGGLFPETYPEECGVCSIFYYESNNPTYRELLFGCYDGYIRYFNDAAKDDNIGANVVTDIEAVNSYVCFGPLLLGRENSEGKLTSLTGILAGGGIGGSQSDSDDVDYKIFTGLSAEKVLEKLVAGTSPNVAGIIAAPGRIRGSVKRQTVRGAFVGIRIGNDDVGETWALERLLVNAKELGRIK